MDIRHQQALNFISFQSAYMLPSIRRADVAIYGRSSAYRLFAQASVLEGVGWLALGSAVGHFDKADAVRSAITLLARPDLDEVLIDRKDLFDLEWHRLLSRSEWEEIGWPVQAISNEDMGLARRAFVSCLEMWSQISRSLTACTTVAQLNFAPFDQIVSLLESEFDASDVADVLEALIDIPEVGSRSVVLAAAVFAGYGESIGFLEGFRTVSQLYAREVDTSANHLIRKVAQLVRWRFVFFQQQDNSLPRSANLARQHQATLPLALLDRYLGVFDVPARTDFHDFLRRLIDDWCSYQAQVAGAGA